MILKLFTFKNFNFQDDFYNGVSKIKSLTKFDKIFTIFWILGPFIYLIERDPADLWLTLISIIFLIKCIKNKDWKWTGQLWFLFAIILWFIGLISAFFGPYTIFSFFQGLAWIRFPLYVAAAQVWLGKDRDIRIVMLASIMVGMLIMSLILTFELILEPKSRLIWPYGDKVPGNYLSKISFSLYCTCIALFFYEFTKKHIFSSFVIFYTLIITFLTGERMNFLIKLFASIFSPLVWKFRLFSLVKIFFISMILGASIIFIVINSSQHIYTKYTKETLQSIPIFNMNKENTYWGAWRSGLQQGLNKPLIGFGPSSSRKICDTNILNDFKWLPGKNYCGNHPHNYYIQLFAETGLIGLIFGTLMFFSIFLTCYKERAENKNCALIGTAYLAPLILFFPIQQTGSFYSQWGNLFVWFAIGYSICQVQNYKSIFK